MTFFLLVFILLYGSLHYYFYNKIRKAFLLTPRMRNGLIALLIALLLTPMEIHSCGLRLDGGRKHAGNRRAQGFPYSDSREIQPHFLTVFTG